MLTEKQFPEDIVKKAYEVYPKQEVSVHDYKETPPRLVTYDSAEGYRLIYMRGMLNERLSAQDKLAEEAYIAGLSAANDFIKDPDSNSKLGTFKNWIQKYKENAE